MKLKEPLNEQDLIAQFNRICEKHLPLKSTLSDLTDQELFIWIAGKTYRFGRPFDKSIENALIHMENKAKAIKSFGARDSETYTGIK